MSVRGSYPQPGVSEIVLDLDLGVVDIENAVGSRLALVELGLAEPLFIESRYRLLRLLGRGARGVVCRAQDMHLHREVALKLYPAHEPGPAAQEVAGEAHALARLKHVNVVGVYDFGHTTLALEARDLGRAGDAQTVAIPCFFMSMELVRGHSVRRWLASRANNRDAILAAFAQAGEGLAHAHEAGVIHRDFKPENVMVDDVGRVSVVDFGLASRRASTRNPTTTAMVRWQPPVIVGTLEYMAPEARVGQADAASDQYSFAVSLHEALLGSLPPVSSAGIAYVDARRFPGAIARVLARALAHAAEHRYPSMRALLDELPRRWDEQWRWTTLADEPADRRRLPWVILAIGGGVLMLSLLAWLAWSKLGDDDKPQQAAATTSPAASEDGCPAAALVGRWQLESVPLWSYNWAYRDRRGRYDLTIERGSRGPPGRNASCEFTAELHKTGTVRRVFDSPFVGHVPVTITGPDHNGTFELVGDWVIVDASHDRQHIAFNLFVDAEQAIRGDFRRFVTPRDKIERPGLIGVARGARAGRRLPSASSVTDVPCASQCNMTCAGDQATRMCRRLQCTGLGHTITDCGPPSPDFEQPYTTAIKIIGRGDWVPAHDPTTCASRTALIVGEWTVAERIANDTRTWTLTLAANGCDLYGSARTDTTTHAVVGQVDAEGRWLVHSDHGHSGPNALRWAMMGWTFAFGSAGGDRPGAVVARKHP